MHQYLKTTYSVVSYKIVAPAGLILYRRSTVRLGRGSYRQRQGRMCGRATSIPGRVCMSIWLHYTSRRRAGSLTTPTTYLYGYHGYTSRPAVRVSVGRTTTRNYWCDYLPSPHHLSSGKPMSGYCTAVFVIAMAASTRPIPEKKLHGALALSSMWRPGPTLPPPIYLHYIAQPALHVRLSTKCSMGDSETVFTSSPSHKECGPSLLLAETTSKNVFVRTISSGPLHRRIVLAFAYHLSLSP